MSTSREKIRLSIIAKLLVWCVALIGVFYLTTMYLFSEIRDISRVAGEETRAYETDAASKRMIQRLLSLEENMRMYEILQDETYRGYVLSDLTGYRDILETVLKKLDAPREPWITLSSDYNALSEGGPSGTVTIPYDTVSSWVALLDEVRQRSREQIRAGLEDIERMGDSAQRMGLAGMIASLAVGLAGSVFIAFGLRRTLKELMRGIRSVGRAGEARRVEVRSADELGELAQAFNTMAERLEREERLRDDFISMLSHEVRTPLTSVRESVDLVGSGVFGEVNEEQKRFLDIAGKEAGRLSALLKRLLSVSSLERGAIPMDLERVDAAELAFEAAAHIEPAAAAKSQSVETRVPSGPVPVMADPERIRQVLMNLLDNAVKFGPAESEIQLELARCDDRPFCVFTVRDRGAGIPEEDRDLVFSKFYRGAAAETGVDGAGLGLSISKALVEAHGGEMWPDDTPGGGAAFCFSLPLADETG